MTHDLGEIPFIPTITINESRDNQKLILRKFRQVVCDSYTGQNIPEACKQT